VGIEGISGVEGTDTVGMVKSEDGMVGMGFIVGMPEKPDARDSSNHRNIPKEREKKQ